MFRKWTAKDDEVLLGLKNSGNTYTQISEFMQIPPSTCKDRYNKLMRDAVKWDDDLDQKLRKAYTQFREEMWKRVGEQVGVPWRAAEDRGMNLGKKLVKK